MALWVYVMYLSDGVRQHGLGHFLRISLFPPGVPWPIYFLLTPIEFLQVFVLRPATLGAATRGQHDLGPPAAGADVRRHAVLPL